MNTESPVLRRLRQQRAPTLFAVVAAFLLGVLVAAVAVPDRGEAVLATGSTTFDPSASDPLGTGGVADAGTTGTAGAGGSATGPDASGSATPSTAVGGGAVATTVPTGGSSENGVGGGGSQGTPGGTPAPNGGATAPGVTADAITIGFGIPDIGAIAALGPGYDQGNPQDHVEAILAQLREEGRLPVNGRDIQPVYSSYNILSEDAQRSTCETFGNDVTVFAVIAIHDFGTGNECTAREFGLPTFTTDGQSEAVYARSAPNLVTLQMSADRLLRNFVAWADREGFLDGAKVGVYYSSDPEAAKVVQDNVIAPIKALGNSITEVQTSNPNTGGPEDSVAVQQFRVNQVDVAILVVSAVAKTNFFTQAQNQDYRPLYLENDIGFSTTDTATSTYPADYFDGTPAFTGMRFGEWNSGIDEPAPAKWCRDAIKKQSGNDIPRKGREAEYIAANQACDEILTVLHGIEQAGPNLTRSAFISGVETIQNRVAGIHGNLTFTPRRHDGVNTWRQIRWHGDCTCWKVDSPIEPLLTN